MVTNAFNGGTLNVAGQNFVVQQNSFQTVTVTNNNATLSFRLHDDDDDTTLPHSHDLTILSLALKDAYIFVLDDAAGNVSNDQTNAAFVSNLSGVSKTADETSFSRQGTRADDYWVAYLLMSYQYTTDSDWDSNYEGGTGGVTWGNVSNTGVASGGDGSQAFVETLRDRLAGGATAGLEERVIAHEICHQLGLDHWDRGEPGVTGTVPLNLMLRTLQTVPNDSSRLVPQHIMILRSRVHSPHS